MADPLAGDYFECGPDSLCDPFVEGVNSGMGVDTSYYSLGFRETCWRYRLRQPVLLWLVSIPISTDLYHARTYGACLQRGGVLYRRKLDHRTVQTAPLPVRSSGCQSF